MKKEKGYKTEFHIHTKTSNDSILSYWLLLVMLKIKGINTIVITDHNEIKGAIKVKNKFSRFNIEVIIGEEIFTNQGEIIGLNLTSKIEKNLSPEETIKQIKQQGGLVYIPHPYDEKREKSVLKEKYIELLKNDIDFIEVYNGRNISEIYEIKQKEIAKKYKLKAIIGSDAHTFFEIGRNYVITKNKITPSNIINEYIEPKFYKRKCIKYAHFCTKIAKVIKMTFRGDLSGVVRIINKRFKR